jgi:hypothetical protein
VFLKKMLATEKSTGQTTASQDKKQPESLVRRWGGVRKLN